MNAFGTFLNGYFASHSNKNLEPSILIVCSSSWVPQFLKTFWQMIHHPIVVTAELTAKFLTHKFPSSWIVRTFGRHQPPVLMNHIHCQFPYFSPSPFTHNSTILIDSFFKCKWSLCCCVNEQIINDFYSGNLIWAILRNFSGSLVEVSVMDTILNRWQTMLSCKRVPGRDSI